MAELLEEETQKEDVSEAIEAERQKVDAITRITEEVSYPSHFLRFSNTFTGLQRMACEESES